MPLVTFFSVLELLEKNRKGGCNNPLLVRRGLKHVNFIVVLAYDCLNPACAM